ncbi:carboxylesterase/lipase family protein [Paenarthrobacter sp. RAF54_2]|uniref:carboxylesterase/lipase family protein n=1 Tax=Paenarthrobacter sp. RAF54_2 TaxID=3233061 RepID=UPI003F9E1189
MENGKLRGTSLPGSGVRRFLGVPYGASTAGEHRWRPPRPATPWKGTRDATAFGSVSWQVPVAPNSLYAGGEQNFSEDCLNLNIWTGAEGETGRPVMVWIHLGAFQFGSANNPMYDGERLAAQGITLVSINHRLGRLGFLAHPELTAESGYGGSGNYGLMDQIEALRFVSRNIAAFGGDPQNVTIFGVSAGGDSVHKLRCSPLAAGLFHKTIAHSGPGVAPAINGPGHPAYVSTLAAGEEAGAQLLTSLGVNSITEARALSPESILAAGIARAKGDWSSDTAPGPGLSVHRYDTGYPVIDGYVLVEPEQRTFMEGRAADVPSIVGNVTNEQPGIRYLTSVAAVKRYLSETFGALADTAFELYPAHSDAEARQASLDLLGDEIFILSSWNAAMLHSSTLTAPVWHFRFLREPPVEGDVAEKDYARAFHGADVLYVFGTYADLEWGWTDEDRALADRMQRAWISFAKTGDPTDGGTIQWPAFRSSVRMSKLWDVSDGLGDISDPAKVAFWEKYRASSKFAN